MKLLQNTKNKKLRRKVPEYSYFGNFTEIQQRHHQKDKISKEGKISKDI